jgi:hypothetical protein
MGVFAMEDVLVHVEDEGENHQDGELVDLGKVSEETKGNPWGATGDGGLGRCWC